MKERIIGAVVLVLVVVLVVPVFLDGPPEDGAILSENVPLPGQSAQETRTVVLDRDRSEPVPTNGAETRRTETPPPQPESQPEARPIVEQPQPEPEAAQEVAEAVAAVSEAASEPAEVVSQTGMWAVQLGSFGNRENAERQAAELRKAGHAAFLSQVATAEGTLHRVRIGPQKDRATADKVAAQLKSAGYTVKVLPHP